MIQAKRDKKCRACGNWFKASNTLHRACSPLCAIAVARQDETRAQRRETKERKEKLKTKGDHTREAQAAFNAFIRERDRGKPCICCGRFSTEKDLITGSEWDAGHYRSTGAAPHLRFNEDNCHRQLVYCNRYLSGNAADYRIGLVNRIGQKRVEALECDQSTKRWSIDELKEIKRHYRQKTKELKNAEKGG